MLFIYYLLLRLFLSHKIHFMCHFDNGFKHHTLLGKQWVLLKVLLINKCPWLPKSTVHTVKPSRRRTCKEPLWVSLELYCRFLQGNGMIDEFAVSDQLWVRLLIDMIFSICVWWKAHAVCLCFILRWWVMGVLCCADIFALLLWWPVMTLFALLVVVDLLVFLTKLPWWQHCTIFLLLWRLIEPLFCYSTDLLLLCFYF